jgi:hypothetical protein
MKRSLLSMTRVPRNVKKQRRERDIEGGCSGEDAGYEWAARCVGGEGERQGVRGK